MQCTGSTSVTGAPEVMRIMTERHHNKTLLLSKVQMQSLTVLPVSRSFLQVCFCPHTFAGNLLFFPRYSTWLFFIVPGSFYFSLAPPNHQKRE